MLREGAAQGRQPAACRLCGTAEALSPRPAMARVVFLFNHDAAHQVAHLAGIAGAFALDQPDSQAIVAYADDAIRQRVESLVSPQAAARIVWHKLALPAALDGPLRLLDRVLPASRLLRLRLHRRLFAEADAVISTERTCLRVRDALPEKSRPLFVRVPHGTGDRSVTFHPEHRKFDLTLVAGQKLKDQLIAHGVKPERIAMTGYAKFENVDLSARPKLFANDRPTFVYNPHFDPHLSSWYDLGPPLLDWFASKAGQRFNLIFAPHVMLFRKPVHVSPEYRIARRRPDIPAATKDAPNILIDVDGPRLFDMTYLLAADAYLGDASSQVYEFLARPRPVVILDPNEALRKEGEAALPFLGTGPVVSDIAAAVARLSDLPALQDAYGEAQRQLIARTFSLGDGSPSRRAAAAIAQAVAARRG